MTANFLILPWIPQREVLLHSSTKVFLSHSGWNSSLESICASVPMVFWPLMGDQDINADWLTRQGVGIKIPNTGLKNSRIVPEHEIVDTIKAVGDESGTYLRAVQKWSILAKQALGADGSSGKEFLQTLTEL